MFVKLCKYEFKSIVRTLAPIYVAALAVSILAALMVGSTQFHNFETTSLGAAAGIWELLQVISMFVYFGVMVALCVLTLIVIVQRFYKGLLSDEGYLMFTLPVKPWQLIAAKGAAAFVMSLASTVIAVLSIMILICGTTGPAEFFSSFWHGWTALVQELSIVAPLWPLYLIEFILVSIVSGLAQMYHIYFSMALGHMANKHRVMMSVVAYIAISTLLNLVFGIGMIILDKIPYISQLGVYMETLPFAQWGNLVINLTLGGLLAVSLVQLALFFFGTERILSKKLNLE